MFSVVHAVILVSWLYTIGQTQIVGKDYGPYSVSWETFETCKGPKQNNCGIFEIESANNISNVGYAIDFQKDCPVTTARITIGSKQSDNVTKKLWNYALDKPCQHFVMGPILVESFNLTTSCKVLKGTYKIHLNMKEKTITFLGSKFFYGIFDFKITAYNKMNNFFCIHAVINVVKRSN